MLTRKLAASITFIVSGFVILSCNVSNKKSLNTFQSKPFQVGNQLIELRHNSRDRSYILHIPPVKPAPGYPVVINFHGAGGNAAGHQKYTGLDKVADRENFIVIYPNGTGPLKKKLLTWNAGSCCGYANKKNIDDVGFIKTIINQINNRLHVDLSKIYATGLSNGAMMAYRLAADASVPPHP